jgi:hypothetical protein
MIGHTLGHYEIIETLADRLAAAGRIEVDEALEIARQIAEGLGEPS